MGTSNFYNKNASRIFVCLESKELEYSECENCGRFYEGEDDYVPEGEMCSCGLKELVEHGVETYSPELWDIEDFYSNVRDYGIAKSTKLKLDYRKLSEVDNNRNFCGTKLFELSKSKTYGDVDITVNIYCIIRSGYYEAANLDWKLYYNEVETLDLEWDFEKSDDLNAGLKVILRSKAESWAKTTGELLVKTMEEIFGEVSQPYKKIATFSNGETIYEKV